VSQRNPRIEFPKLRKAAQGADCLLRIPGVCNFDTETTVLCHRPGGGSMGMKQHDYLAVNGCYACHSVLDGREPSELTRDQLLILFDVAWKNQLEDWFRQGLIR